jgi:hypothetical protein
LWFWVVVGSGPVVFEDPQAHHTVERLSVKAGTPPPGDDLRQAIDKPMRAVARPLVSVRAQVSAVLSGRSAREY